MEQGRSDIELTIVLEIRSLPFPESHRIAEALAAVRILSAHLEYDHHRRVLRALGFCRRSELEEAVQACIAAVWDSLTCYRPVIIRAVSCHEGTPACAPCAVPDETFVEEFRPSPSTFCAYKLRRWS